MQACLRQNLRRQLCFARFRLKLPAAHGLLQRQRRLRPMLRKPVIVCRFTLAQTLVSWSLTLRGVKPVIRKGAYIQTSEALWLSRGNGRLEA